MTDPAGARNSTEQPEPPDSPDPGAVREASAWVHMWSRTLKTWRLYGEHSPTLEKFRADLAGALATLLEHQGAITLRFTSDTILWRDTPLQQARSREDNLSGVFFRDGIQSITFSPGMERDELELFLAATIKASDRLKQSEEDLVTLLWDAELPHLDMSYVSSVASLDLDDEGGEGGQGSGFGTGSSAPPMGWPGTGGDGPDAASPPQPSIAGAAGAASDSPESAATRSEDWPTHDPDGPLAEQFDELDATATGAVTRFQRERADENAVDRGAAMLMVVVDAFGSGLQPGDRAALVPLLERLFLDALGRSAWAEARRAIALWLESPAQAEDREAWLASLAQPESMVTAGVVRQLDRQGQAEIGAFLELVATIGARGLDWYLVLLTSSEQERVRRPLARAIADMGANEIPRLARWLADPRGDVVRDVVHILGLIGGDATLEPLPAVVRHEDQRVRLEVLTVLATATPEAARPMLLELLTTDDARVLSGTLHQLSARRDREVAHRILERVLAPGFVDLPAEAQRAVLSALGATGDDALLPTLAELLNPTWKPGPGATGMLQGLALCVARIATPNATQLLQNAQRSRWRATREAATLALAAWGSR